LRVIGAGFGRTGTTSLKAALETLGLAPCYHMVEVFAHPRHAEAWRAAWRGEPVDWDALLGPYEATVDWPGCTFYAELMERYPDAKVLLSVRDPERWHESTRTTIYELSRINAASRTARVAFGLVSLFTFGGFARTGAGEEIIWNGTFDGRFEDKTHAIEVLERHNEEVKRRVPPERLLVYEVRQGWGPLCEFLGVPEPDEPFPHLNDAAEMRRGIRMLRALSIAVPTFLGLLAGTLLLLFVRRSRVQNPSQKGRPGGRGRPRAPV
jgi:sulfotransferase family protein